MYSRRKKRLAPRLVFLLALRSTLAPPAGAQSAPAPLSAEAIFAELCASVFVVEALGPDGEVVGFGSGVVVDSERVATNCHVVEKGASNRISRGEQTWAAAIDYLDPEHDLCQLTVPGLAAPPVPIRASPPVRIGERVYAIGAPMGLELTLSEGLISGLRVYRGLPLIQTTAPVSADSSGGGLFDTQGRLVGLTTMWVKGGRT
jgi:S1-C subfamily serine protease